MSFKADFAKLTKKAGDRVDDVVRKTALQLQSEMVSRSPVLSGRFKGNWQPGIGAINLDTSSAPGTDAKAKTKVALQGWKTGQTIYLTNALPYARRLEYGWSKQAPGGMVRLTVANYAQALSKAVRDINK